MDTESSTRPPLATATSVSTRYDYTMRPEYATSKVAAITTVKQMIWQMSNRADPLALPLADRHYSRQKPGTAQFVPPGSCVVFRALGALWVTSWPLAEFTQHAWAGAWVNSFFRKECAGKASDYILEAVAATRYWYAGDGVPALGMVSFVDPKHVKPIMRRGQPIYGYCYLRAGFEHVGYTKVKKQWVWQLLPERMPAAAPAVNMQLEFAL